MALTGRTALLAALGALVVGLLLPGLVGTRRGRRGCCSAGGARRPGAGRRGARAGARPGPATRRCASAARRRASWWCTNPGPAAGCAACCATPGRRAPARPRRAIALIVPAGERRRLTATLRPTRRGDRRAVRVTVRSLGPLGLAARQGTHEVPWTVRVAAAVHLAPAPAVAAGPAARAGRPRRGARSAGRAPSSTRCAST